MKKKKRILGIGIAAAVLAAVVLWIVWGNTALELKTYTVIGSDLPHAFAGFRIAQISDYHNTEMGKDNEKLISLLREADPDIIVITGDMIDSRRTEVDVALRLAEQAMEIAPCCYAPGNHEARVSEYSDLKAGLLALGVTVLEDARVELVRGEEKISLVGINDPSFRPFAQFGDERTSTHSTLQALTAGAEAFTVLLSHRPELFSVYADNQIDLVFSGHAHGGQFRLPFVGGIIAPHQGLFPTYDAGLYTEGDTHMLVSRGIGNSIVPFRINNRPEVILVELQPAGESAETGT